MPGEPERANGVTTLRISRDAGWTMDDLIDWMPFARGKNDFDAEGPRQDGTFEAVTVRFSAPRDAQALFLLLVSLHPGSEALLTYPDGETHRWTPRE